MTSRTTRDCEGLADEHINYANDYTEAYAISTALASAKDALGRAQGLAHRGASNPRRVTTRAAVDEARRALDNALAQLNEETRMILGSIR